MSPLTGPSYGEDYFAALASPAPAKPNGVTYEPEPYVARAVGR